jgi:hypothetical protein
MDWLAILIQRPDLVGMPVAVLRSAQGAGKGSIIDNFLIPLFGQSGLIIEKPDLLVGRFGGHLALNCLTSANEAVWGGDAQKAGAYKALITDQHRMIEMKFKDAFMSRNFTSLIMSTNEDWFAPTNAQDRRHAVFDVSDRRLGDKAYFAKLISGVIQRRGRQAMLHNLLQRDIDIDSMRKPPSWQSDAAEINLLNGMDPMFSFLHEVLSEGSIHIPPYGGEPDFFERSALQERDMMKDVMRVNTGAGCRYVWPDNVEMTILKSDLYQAYMASAKGTGRRYPYSPAHFWKVAKSVFGDQEVRFKVSGDRYRAVVMPNLDDARARFSTHLGRTFLWGKGVKDLDKPEPEVAGPLFRNEPVAWDSDLEDF